MGKQPSPFCKWAGGKGQLLDRIRERCPASYGDYYEPFVGAGAVLFGLVPRHAHVNDINAQLMNAYFAIRDDCEQVIACLDALDGSFGNDAKSYYYSIRDRYNEGLIRDSAGPEMAALFIFLNKHCFNGLYRVNSKGLFNVPYNNSVRSSYSRENLMAVSEYLGTVEIACGDFAFAVEGAGKHDFVFFDSPYAPLNETSFEAYTKEGFAQAEHERLAALFRELDERGCYCMLTNHDTELIRNLYDGFHVETVAVKRMINSDARKRTGEEVIVRNYV